MGRRIVDSDMSQAYLQMAATQIEVASQVALDAAYAALDAGSGGTILLAGGTAYTFQAFDGDDRISAPVTIRSLDADDPARISGLRLNGIENLTIEDVHFHLEDVAETFDDAIIGIRDSRHITIRDSLATSDATGPLGTEAGHAKAAQMAIVRDSSGVSFEGNILRDLRHGITFKDSHDGTIRDNDIAALQGDGIRIAGVSGLLVQGNHIHDLLGATWETNHADMIQIWGNGITVNNESITIRENFLDTGNGANAQMIFGHNEHFAQNGFVFRDILIEHNVLFGAHTHAISLNHTDGVTVRHNTVLHNPEAYSVLADGTTPASSQVGRIAIGGTNTQITHNIAPRIDGGDESNIRLGPEASAHIVNLEAGGSGDLRDLMLRPDSPLNGTHGSAMSWSDGTAAQLLAVADVTIAPHDRSLVTLDAGLSRGPEGLAMDSGATFLWRFGDGHTAEGARVTHDFATAGQQAYSLTVTLPDGESDQITRSVMIESPLALHLTANALGAGTSRLLDGAQLAEGWIGIGGRARLELDREIDALFEREAFNIGLTVAAAPGEAGMLLQLPETLTAALDGRGRLDVTLSTDAGAFTVKSPRPLFVDTDSHALNLLYDGAAETLTLIIDGDPAASVAARGTTAPVSYWGLTLGATWHDGVEARVRDLYVMTEAIPFAETGARAAPEDSALSPPPLSPPPLNPQPLPRADLDLGGTVDDFS